MKINNTTQDTELIHENTHLKQVIVKVSKAKDTLESAMKALGAFNLDKLKELRDNPAANSSDFLQFMDMLKNKSDAFNIPDKYKRLEELTNLAKEPYFSRIDITNGDTKNLRGDKKVDLNHSTHYIGKFGYTEEDKPLVLDWRSKVASIYYRYRYPQKGVVYETPDGIVKTDLLLKRTFEIDNGELIKFYNNDIKLDESEIIADKISERTGGVLEDIVETIQENQHEIIEADPRQVCIVQGTVGSGKSTVAIHKLSHIFFNFPDLIHANRSILIAKNQILVGYLSTLFPKLGIFDINYGTVRDLIYKLVFREEMAIKFDLNLEKDISSFDLRQLNKLKEDIKAIHEQYREHMAETYAIEENQSFAGFVYDPNLPVKANLNEGIEDLEEEIEFQTEFIKEHPMHSRAELFKKNIKTMRRITKKFTDLRANLKTSVLHELAKSYGVYKNPTLGYLQTLIYVFIYGELIGFKNTQKYEYCVVDEGQDFGVLEYAILNKMVINGRMSILGDLNQSYAKEGLSDWDEIVEVISGARKAHKFTLDTNYRSTRPIIEFANLILSSYTDKYLPISINRVGAKPEVKSFPTNNDMLVEFEKNIIKDVKALNKSIGIICMDENLLDNVEKIITKLKLGQEFIKLNDNDRISYLPRAVYLTHFENCKGLEFGKVYILGLNLSEVANFTDAKKAFVAVTRAMDELHIYGNKNIN
ncbi:hypothetical protein HYV31_02195 [candidate division WWE3 bacterium]|nr:hypothetical protein [candidate division WWE3 bacterium]